MGIIKLEFIVGVVIGSCLGFSCLIFTWLKRNPWENQFYKAKTTLKPGASGAKKLEHLIRLLSNIESWLSSDNTLLIPGVRDSLWKQTLYLNVQRQFYLANYSRDIDQKNSALRQLCWVIKQLLIVDKGKAREAIEVMIGDPHTEDEVRTQILNELGPKSAPRSVRIKGKTKELDPNKVQGTQNHIQINNMLNNHIGDEAMNAYNTDTNLQAQGDLTINGDVVGRDKIVNHITDLSTLASELATLRTELKKKLSQEPEHDVAIGAIASAEAEAKKGNEPKALEYLKQAGNWALEAATQIGEGVAAAAISKALGLGVK